MKIEYLGGVSLSSGTMNNFSNYYSKSRGHKWNDRWMKYHRNKNCIVTKKKKKPNTVKTNLPNWKSICNLYYKGSIFLIYKKGLIKIKKEMRAPLRIMD